MVLKSAGHEVVGVRAGQSALELLEQQPFDVLVTDIRMGPVDGLQVMKAARERAPQMPLIAISAIGAEQTIAAAQRLGCAAYIRKPFHMEDVLDAVDRAVRGRASPP